MATQPIITKLKIVNPQVSDNPRTYMTADFNASSSSVSLSIFSKRGFFKLDRNNKTKYFVLVGDYNQEKTEISVVTSDDTDNKILVLSSGLSNSHSAADPITFVEYNKIQIFGATTPGGTKTLLSTITIDATQNFTEYVYMYTAGVDPIQYSYFTTAFYNDAITGYETLSAYSEEIQSTTFNRRSVKRVIDSASIKALTKVEESPTSVLNWDNCIDIVQDGIDEIQVRKRNWAFWRTIYSGFSTTIGVPYVSKPTDLGVMEFVKVDGQKVDFISRTRYLQLTSLLDMPVETGKPSYYTDKNDMYYFFPTPDKVYTVEYDYYYTPPTVSDLSDEIPLPLVPILIYYCAAQFAYIRGNDKRGDKMYVMFNKMLEQQVDEYTGPDQIGDADSIEETDTRYWEE